MCQEGIQGQDVAQGLSDCVAGIGKAWAPSEILRNIS